MLLLPALLCVTLMAAVAPRPYLLKIPFVADAYLYFSSPSPRSVGDGRNRLEISLESPSGLAQSREGSLFVTDRIGFLWEIGSDGKARVVAGTGMKGKTGTRINALEVDLGSPEGVCLDLDDAPVFADSANHIVVGLGASGRLLHIAGNRRAGYSGDGGDARYGSFREPHDVQFDSLGNLFVADTGNHCIRQVSPEGILTTVAGTGKAGFSGDGGPAIKAQLYRPTALFIDTSGRLLIADTLNHSIRRVSKDGTIETIAGTGFPNYRGDLGPATKADFNGPAGLCVSPNGDILIGDQRNHCVRVLGAGRQLSTLVGRGYPGLAVEGAESSDSLLNTPRSILITQDGSTLIADSNNSRVVQISSEGIVQTFAGRKRRLSVARSERSDLGSTADPTTAQPVKRLGSVGTFEKWSRIEVAFNGPDSSGTGKPNPFSVFVDFVLSAPSGKLQTVPGFYDGDGHGGLEGRIWKLRFSADEEGRWTLVSQSREPHLDGIEAEFTVLPTPPDASGFWRLGRLEYVGTPENRLRYLKFRDGPYWLKAGCDDPENFLGKYKNFDTPEERHRTIDFLAERGINSQYMVVHNIDGDYRDVWPWLGDTEAEAKANSGTHARFDLAKLEEWRQLFEHMQTQGVVPYLVLADDEWATRIGDRQRLYREIVARFGYLPALLFNYAEEEWALDEGLADLAFLERLDPYDHPRGIHNVNVPVDDYVDGSQVDFSSIQTYDIDPLRHNAIAIHWINRCTTRGKRVVMVGFDEARPLLDRRAWWAAYMAGAVWEAHLTEPYDRPISAWDATLTQLGGARRFMEELPFWEMTPANGLVVSGKAFCLASPGKVYALYLPEGNTIRVDLVKGRQYVYSWWKGSNGKLGQFENEGTIDGGVRELKAPGPEDWALRIAAR